MIWKNDIQITYDLKKWHSDNLWFEKNDIQITYDLKKMTFR